MGRHVSWIRLRLVVLTVGHIVADESENHAGSLHFFLGLNDRAVERQVGDKLPNDRSSNAWHQFRQWLIRKLLQLSHGPFILPAYEAGTGTEGCES